VVNALDVIEIKTSCKIIIESSEAVILAWLLDISQYIFTAAAVTAKLTRKLPIWCLWQRIEKYMSVRRLAWWL